MKNIKLAFALVFSFSAAAAAAEFAGISIGEIQATRIEVPEPAAAPARAQLTPLNEKNKLPAALANNPLIVVHASDEFDENEIAAAGINDVVAGFKAAKRPVVYLLNDQSERGYGSWYPAERAPDYELFSEGGEHNLPLAADEVTIVGGFFGSYDGSRGCQTLATRDAIRMHFELSDRPFTVYMPLKAVYFYDEDSNTRDELLALDTAAVTAAAVRKVFKNFPESFFLTDNFVVSTDDALGFGHPYGEGGADTAYRAGEPVDTARYTFRLFFNGIQVGKFGTGPRLVSLKLSN